MGGSIIQKTGTSEKIVVNVSVVAVFEQKLVLVHGATVLARGRAFKRVGAGVSDQNSLELDDRVSRAGHFVMLQDFPGQPWHVDARIAFSADIEVVFLQVRELLIELQQGHKIVLGNRGIGMKLLVRNTVADSSGRLDV